jgi:periplasmic divalent cation tolerance protein
MDIRLLYVTCASGEEAREIARALVEARLAACCNLLSGMESVYRWQGRIETAREIVLIAKTRESLVAAATAMIRSKHSHKVPCAISLPVPDGGNTDYLAWLRAETS